MSKKKAWANLTYETAWLDISSMPPRNIDWDCSPHFVFMLPTDNLAQILVTTIKGLFLTIWLQHIVCIPFYLIYTISATETEKPLH